ncbi:hypothetical protein IWX90DRAFT_12885 [Phyllosticta citrichinensis]|uniref:Secreted protein n=1 Tax=Phyllosticta citrichinensis TaxID=1130410 RepID=A0ABR1Y686_9PEZI
MFAFAFATTASAPISCAVPVLLLLLLLLLHRMLPNATERPTHNTTTPTSSHNMACGQISASSFVFHHVSAARCCNHGGHALRHDITMIPGSGLGWSILVHSALASRCVQTRRCLCGSAPLSSLPQLCDRPDSATEPPGYMPRKAADVVFRPVRTRAVPRWTWTWTWRRW